MEDDEWIMINTAMSICCEKYKIWLFVVLNAFFTRSILNSSMFRNKTIDFSGRMCVCLDTCSFLFYFSNLLLCSLSHHSYVPCWSLRRKTEQFNIIHSSIYLLWMRLFYLLLDTIYNVTKYLKRFYMENIRSHMRKTKEWREWENEQMNGEKCKENGHGWAHSHTRAYEFGNTYLLLDIHFLVSGLKQQRSKSND